jgi:hypothetical protein
MSSLIIPFPQLVCDILLFCECFFDRLVPYLPCHRWRSLLYWPFPLTSPRVVPFSLDYPCLYMLSSDISDVREIENFFTYSAPVDVLHFFCSKIIVGLPQNVFYVPVVCILASHCFRNLQHSVIQFGVKILFSYLSKSQLNISCSMPHSSCVDSIRIHYNVTNVSSLLKCPRKYCNCPYSCTASK